MEEESELNRGRKLLGFLEQCSAWTAAERCGLHIVMNLKTQTEENSGVNYMQISPDIYIFWIIYCCLGQISLAKRDLCGTN